MSAWHAWSRAALGSVSTETWRQYTAAVLRFLALTGLATGRIEVITRTHVLTYFGEHVPRGHAKVAAYAALTHFFRWCDFEGLVVRSPMLGVAVRRPQPREPLALTVDELYRLVDGVERIRGTRAALCVLLGYQLGVRRSELVGIRWSDVHEGADGPIVRLPEVKGGRRDVPLSAQAITVLASLHEMPHRYAREARRELVVGVGRHTFSEWVHGGAMAAGVDPAKAHSHILRATFATDALRSGANPVTVQRLLGHAKLTTTMRYFATLDADKRAAVVSVGQVTDQLVRVLAVLRQERPSPFRHSPPGATHSSTLDVDTPQSENGALRQEGGRDAALHQAAGPER